MTCTIPASPPPTTCLHFPSKFERSPHWILPKFSAIPPFGLSVTTDPQGINNDRSLMRFAVIMQHANMAYHVQRAYKGPTIWLLRGGGGGIGDSRKKTSWSLILSTRKILQGNTCHRIALYVRENYSITRGSGKKNSYANPKSNGRSLITCRKSCYRLILGLRHQSLIVHSRSKLVHVYSLLHDECNTAGRLGTF